MPHVVISADAERAIRARARPTFAASAVRVPGTSAYRVFLSPDTFGSLVAASLAGESLSDTIVRLCATLGGRVLQ